MKIKRPASCRSGFTLIELLVVVLIIGILAAIALPRYRIAVLRTKHAELSKIVATFVNAQQRHFLAQGSFTKDLNDLDVPLPTTCRSTSTLANSTIRAIEFSLPEPAGCYVSRSGYLTISVRIDSNTGKICYRGCEVKNEDRKLALKICDIQTYFFVNGIRYGSEPYPYKEKCN